MKEITFNLFNLVCRHFGYSYDSYNDRLECACHHENNIPNGSSWGICEMENCPYLKDEVTE